MCKNLHKIVETRNFKHYKIFDFKQDIYIAFSHCKWNADEGNPLWKQFGDKFNEVDSLHAPFRQRRVKSKYAPSLNKEIQNLMIYRDLTKTAVKIKSNSIISMYTREPGMV